MRARNARLALATVLAEGLLWRLTFGMVSFTMPLYAHKIGLPLSLIGILVSIRTLCVLPLKPAAGWLADRIGVRRVYLLGIFARTLSAAMLLFAGGFAGLMARIVIALVAEILALRVFGELSVWQRARLPRQPRYSPRATGGT